ncbi:Uncharacterised protein [Serratia marcescens]|nr:Uncharacterised protein [Serratia marcescens]
MGAESLKPSGDLYAYFKKHLLQKEQLKNTLKHSFNQCRNCTLYARKCAVMHLLKRRKKPFLKRELTMETFEHTLRILQQNVKDH